MIGTLRGRLTHKSPQGVIIEAAGVGYMVTVPTGTLSSLPSVGHDAFLYIYTHVREDALLLYGFSTEDEKRIFLALLGITGIGPKVAMNIVSGMSHDDFIRAVEAGDTDSLSRIPGLGKKTAQRIVLEMKGKLPADEVTTPVGAVASDALSALVNLGYKKSEALDAIEAVRGRAPETIEGLLKEALKYLTGGQRG